MTEKAENTSVYVSLYLSAVSLSIPTAPDGVYMGSDLMSLMVSLKQKW